MNGIDMFLVQYGLAAIFILTLVKAIGVPIPIPGDLILLTAAARVAQGKLGLWQAFVALLLALVVGGLVQFWLARGPGRGLLYRFGRYIGLTTARLDAAAAKVKKGGIISISVATLVPGVRSAAIVAGGLASVPLRIFLPGLFVGSTVFLAAHFFLGYLGGSILTVIGQVLPLPTVILLVFVLLVAAFGLWVIGFRRQKAARDQTDAAPVEVFHEGICPVCLALYTMNQLHISVVDKVGQL